MRSAATMMKQRMRADLKAALAAGERQQAALLRVLIAALDNAEAVPLTPGLLASLGPTDTEVPRLALDEGAVATILTAEIADREQHAEQFARLGHPARAQALRHEVQLIRRHLG